MSANEQLMATLPIEPSTSPAEAIARFTADLRDWIDQCIAELTDVLPIENHDQGTFATAWEPYIRHRDYEPALTFIKGIRDGVRRLYADRLGWWDHGYWHMQEAHHGTEHFELLLGCLHRLDGDDPQTRADLLDAAEHMGNWVDEIEPWFDWSSGLFRSVYFGTRGVKLEPGMEVNRADHFRCVNICLIAHEMSADGRYLELAGVHSRRWARAILAQSAIPLGLTADGPVLDEQDQGADVYRRVAGQATIGSDVDNAENFLASGAPNALLKLWEMTGEEDFRQAAGRLIQALAGELSDPDAGCVADICRTWRRVTGDDRHDSAIRQAAGRLGELPGELTIRGGICRGPKPSGAGKRGDKPEWYADGQPLPVHPITLAAAAEIDGDESLAVAALDLARTQFALARAIYPHGHEHGCSAETVSAIARGHGRENHAGAVTAVLAPLMEGA